VLACLQVAEVVVDLILDGLEGLAVVIIVARRDEAAAIAVNEPEDRDVLAIQFGNTCRADELDDEPPCDSRYNTPEENSSRSGRFQGAVIVCLSR
jgi:hypothetical protein